MGSRRLNLRQFFTVTGILLIVFAAGLLAHGIHEFQEAGLLPMTVEHVWDTNGVVNEDSNVGQFLTALFGYNGNPSLLEVVAWPTYLGHRARLLPAAARHLAPADRAGTSLSDARTGVDKPSGLSPHCLAT